VELSVQRVNAPSQQIEEPKIVNSQASTPRVRLDALSKGLSEDNNPIDEKELDYEERK
jgi:hypothetical protein